MASITILDIIEYSKKMMGDYSIETWFLDLCFVTYFGRTYIWRFIKMMISKWLTTMSIRYVFFVIFLQYQHLYTIWFTSCCGRNCRMWQIFSLICHYWGNGQSWWKCCCHSKFFVLDRSLMIGWRKNSWNTERVSSVFTSVSVCVSVCPCVRGIQSTPFELWT